MVVVQIDHGFSPDFEVRRHALYATKERTVHLKILYKIKIPPAGGGLLLVVSKNAPYLCGGIMEFTTTITKMRFFTMILVYGLFLSCVNMSSNSNLSRNIFQPAFPVNIPNIQGATRRLVAKSYRSKEQRRRFGIFTEPEGIWQISMMLLSLVLNVPHGTFSSSLLGLMEICLYRGRKILRERFCHICSQFEDGGLWKLWKTGKVAKMNLLCRLVLSVFTHTHPEQIFLRSNLTGQAAA